MLELLAYVVLLVVVMPALLFGAGKFIASASARASSGGVIPHAESLAQPDYGTLHQRLNAAAKANPLLPRVFTWSKGR